MAGFLETQPSKTDRPSVVQTHLLGGLLAASSFSFYYSSRFFFFFFWFTDLFLHTCMRSFIPSEEMHNNPTVTVKHSICILHLLLPTRERERETTAHARHVKRQHASRLLAFPFSNDPLLELGAVTL